MAEAPKPEPTRIESADDIRRLLAEAKTPETRTPTVIEAKLAHEATRIESAEDVRRALEAEKLGEHGTRIESASEIRRIMAETRPPQKALETPPGAVTEAPLPREATRIESAEEVRKARAPAAPPPLVKVPAALPFRPSRRPPQPQLIICDDGSPTGETVRLRGERTVIGRGDGDVRIPHETMMSTRHAEIVRESVEGRWRWALVDLGSTNGVFVRTRSAPLTHGQEILIGSTRLRFDEAALNLPGAIADTSGSLPTKTVGWTAMKPTDLKASLVELTPAGEGKRHFLDAADTIVGREPGSGICLEDVLINARHAKVSRGPQGEWTLTDLDSLNGVWLRTVRQVLEKESEFQLGEQRFVFKMSG